MSEATTSEEFPVGMRVLYIPNHAHGNIGHHDVEVGVVTSSNESYVFVQFDHQQTSKACRRVNLQPA